MRCHSRKRTGWAQAFVFCIAGTWLFKSNGDICMDSTFIGAGEEVRCYTLSRFSASSETLSLPKAFCGVTLQSSFSVCFVAFFFHYLLSPPLPLCLNLLSINHPSTNTAALHSALHPRLLYSLFGGDMSSSQVVSSVHTSVPHHSLSRRAPPSHTLWHLIHPLSIHPFPFSPSTFNIFYSSSSILSIFLQPSYLSIPHPSFIRPCLCPCPRPDPSPLPLMSWDAATLIRLPVSPPQLSLTLVEMTWHIQSQVITKMRQLSLALSVSSPSLSLSLAHLNI